MESAAAATGTTTLVDDQELLDIYRRRMMDTSSVAVAHDHGYNPNQGVSPCT